MHDYFLKDDKNFNLIPFMGDVRLRAFTSHTINQVKWRQACDTFEQNRATKPLTIRRENGQLVTIYYKNSTFLEIEGCKEEMLATQRWRTDLYVR